MFATSQSRHSFVWAEAAIANFDSKPITRMKPPFIMQINAARVVGGRGRANHWAVLQIHWVDERRGGILGIPRRHLETGQSQVNESTALGVAI